jgi:hypothetical protein
LKIDCPFAKNVHITASYKGVRGNDLLGHRVESMALKQRDIGVAVAVPSAGVNVPYLAESEYYGKSHIKGIEVFAVKNEIGELDPQGNGTLTEMLDFVSTFWALATHGVISGVLGVHGHGNLGALSISLVPQGKDRVVRLFTPDNDFGRLYSPDSEEQVRLLGGWDAETGPAHQGKMSAFKLGVLSAHRILMTTWQLLAVQQSDLGGFLDHHLKVSPDRFMISDRLFLEEKPGAPVVLEDSTPNSQRN